MTVALGEPGRNGPTYIPDELVVLFDPALSSHYRIRTDLGAIDLRRDSPRDRTSIDGDP